MSSAERFLLGLCALVSLSACERREPTRARSIKLGLLSSFTGQDQGLAQSSGYAVELAIQQINAAGGPLPGQLVELARGDDGLDPAQGKREAARLIDEEQVVALVGPETTAINVEALRETVSRGVPNVSCCATGDGLSTAEGQTEYERFFFRTVPTDSFQAPVLARAAVECFACKALAVFHIDDDYGNPLAENVREVFSSEAGQTIAYDVAYDAEAPSFRDEVEAAAATSADCGVIIGLPDDGARVRRAWASYAGRDVHWLGSEGILQEPFADGLLDPTLAQGILVTSPIFEPDSTHARTFQRLFQATYGVAPQAFDAQSFDAAALLLLAIARAGSADPSAIRDALFEVSRPDPGDRIVAPGELSDAITWLRAGVGINYEGASGAVDFDGFGNVQGDYELYTFDTSGKPSKVGLVREDKPLPCP